MSKVFTIQHRNKDTKDWNFVTTGLRGTIRAETPNRSPRYVFVTGKEASEWIKNEAYYNSKVDYRVFPLTIDDLWYNGAPLADYLKTLDTWEDREKETYGDKSKLCWHDEPWFSTVHTELKHYLEVTDEGFVRYYMNLSDSRRNIKCGSTTIGRYLNTFADQYKIDSAEIARLSIRHSETFEKENYKLHFTTDPDQIEEVYVNGPSSCMSIPMWHEDIDPDDDDGYFEDIPEHPTRVYGNSPDLALAYLTNKQGEYSARTLVWPDKKIYGRVYGDEDRITTRLKEQGYTQNHLEGARIKKVPVPHPEGREKPAYLGPYVDYCPYVHEKGEFLIISKTFNPKTSVAAQMTGGILYSHRYCPECDANSQFDGVNAREVNETYCSDCAKIHLWYCEHCNYHSSKNDKPTTVYVGKDETQDVCPYCVRNYTASHTVDGRTYLRSSVDRWHQTSGGKYVPNWMVNDRLYVLDGADYIPAIPPTPTTPSPFILSRENIPHAHF